MAKNISILCSDKLGKGFIDHVESQRITFKGLPGDVWQVPAYNKHGNLWIAKVGGVVKTVAEAQAIVDAEVQAAQAAWDALPDAEKAPALEMNTRPTDITLEE